MTQRLNYFAYGSNMSSLRLQSRIPSARALCVGVLREHDLRFHKIGHNDQSGKCDAFYTGQAEHEVHGVVFQFAAEHKATLDKIEGVGEGYLVKTVQVDTAQGSIEAFSYLATAIDVSMQPWTWYKEHVLRGALEHQLPSEYTARIRATLALSDVDNRRHENELAIYANVRAAT